MTDYEKAVKEAEKRQEEIADAFAGKVASAMQGWYEQTTTYQLKKLTDLLQQTNELLERLITSKQPPQVLIGGKEITGYLENGETCFPDKDGST